MGMTSDEYWFGDPSLIYNYQNAFNRKQEYDLQMAWTMGAYIKSALGSTQVWTVTPAKASDWKQMPKYVENPLKERQETVQQQPMTKERQEHIRQARSKLAAMGFLGKK